MTAVPLRRSTRPARTRRPGAGPASALDTLTPAAGLGLGIA